MSRDALPAADDDEFYHADLIGLRAEDDAGRVIGTVRGDAQFRRRRCDRDRRATTATKCSCRSRARSCRWIDIEGRPHRDRGARRSRSRATEEAWNERYYLPQRDEGRSARHRGDAGRRRAWREPREAAAAIRRRIYARLSTAMASASTTINVLIAELDGKIVGVVATRLYSRPVAQGCQTRAIVESVRVEVRYARQECRHRADEGSHRVSPAKAAAAWCNSHPTSAARARTYFIAASASSRAMQGSRRR